MSLRTVVAALACVASMAHAATFVVTNTNDSDAGSLRQAFLDSNADVDPDENFIEFAIGNGAKTIQPASPLPAVTQAVTIDGSTQPDWTGAPLITKNARTVPEPVRTELGSLITAAQADVTIVKTGLACP